MLIYLFYILNVQMNDYKVCFCPNPGKLKLPLRKVRLLVCRVIVEIHSSFYNVGL